MTKTALFVFNGDPMCFIHVLLNALDMAQRGETVKIVVEGAATELVPALANEKHPLYILWQKVKDQGLVAGVCKACAKKTEILEAAAEQGLALLDAMNGHPSMAAYRETGYNIITF
ncbi:MAG: DsrE family protein [Desulfobacterales bacterium]|nr:DsrE family protein [Desulfobacterales bacterium]